MKSAGPNSSGLRSGVCYEVDASQVVTLKEIKQVQLQILELQASVQKTDAPSR